MTRWLLGVAILALALTAEANRFTRWVEQPVEGATRIVSGGPGSETIVALRDGREALRSFDGGLSWSPFTVDGARPLAVSIAPTVARTWYAVVDSAGTGTDRRILRTRNGGDTWEERSVISNRYPLAPQVGPDPDQLFLAAFEIPQTGFPVPPGSFARVLASSDGGRTWSEPNAGARVYRFVRSAADARVAYATSGADIGKVVRTLDAGATWTSMPLPTERVGASFMTLAHIALDRVDARIAYVRPEQGRSAFAEDIYVTRDGGQSWWLIVQPQGAIVADPLVAGRAFLSALDGRLLETRDAGRTWATVDAGVARPNTGFGVDDPPGFVVAARDGRRSALATGSAKLSRIDLTNGALALGSDLWWNPAESGAGLTFTQHASNNPFTVWYTYDASGAPVWRVIPGGTWNDRTLTGDMYETTGPPYFAGAFDPARVTSRKVGTATLRFDDENNATFAFTLTAGVSGEKRITRQQFAPPTPTTMESVADLWWNASESGWGMAVNHQSSRVFVTWYVYGDDGKPLWVVMPDALVASEFVGATIRPSATGDLYTTRGPAEGTAFDPSKVVSTKVGTAKLLWRSQNTIDLEYTAFGRTERRSLTRQPF